MKRLLLVLVPFLAIFVLPARAIPLSQQKKDVPLPNGLKASITCPKGWEHSTWRADDNSSAVLGIRVSHTISSANQEADIMMSPNMEIAFGGISVHGSMEEAQAKAKRLVQDWKHTAQASMEDWNESRFATKQRSIKTYGSGRYKAIVVYHDYRGADSSYRDGIIVAVGGKHKDKLGKDYTMIYRVLITGGQYCWKTMPRDIESVLASIRVP
ncbi:MAG: hypothetical protein Q7T82_18115 [Armatimonadota bacterium]|nr:hypothetical protein [Armatimonadota bacterium]